MLETSKAPIASSWRSLPTKAPAEEGSKKGKNNNQAAQVIEQSKLFGGVINQGQAGERHLIQTETMIKVRTKETRRLGSPFSPPLPSLRNSLPSLCMRCQGMKARFTYQAFFEAIVDSVARGFYAIISRRCKNVKVSFCAASNQANRRSLLIKTLSQRFVVSFASDSFAAEY
jgi:hypothetical protein